MIGVSTNPIAIGFTLSALIYVGALISGAHFNPAISLGAFWLNKLSIKEFGGYVLGQTIGAMLAAVTVLMLSSLVFYVEAPLNSTFYQQLTIEVLLSFVLVLVALTAWIGKPSNKSVATYAFIMGFSFAALTMAGESISGSVFNPALSIGTAIVDLMFNGASYLDIPLYTVGPLFGASLAAIAYKYFKPDLI